VRVDGMEAAVGAGVHQREAGGRDLRQEPESEPSWLSFGRAV
jgi:hypothetical protein